MKKKVLLTGGSGLLAINWAFAIANEYDVVLGLHDRMITVPRIQTVSVGMETRDEFSRSLDIVQPDIVIHCAGLANVEVCEADPANAIHINGVLSENVAKGCKEKDLQLVYICTDHLFTGNKSLVTEEDPAVPVNEYGKTKLSGEVRTLAISEKFLSVRTNFYGWGPFYRHSFSDMIIDNLQEGNLVTLFEDFYYTPILIEELAQVVMQLLQMKAGGIFNVVGNERISKLEFGMRLAKKFKLDTNLIKASRFSERKDLVKRPKDLSLSNQKVSKLLKREIGSIDAGIGKLHQQSENGFLDAIREIRST